MGAKSLFNFHAPIMQHKGTYHVLMEIPSDFKEGLLPVDVWKSATTTPGGQCAMTDGKSVMLR